MCVYLLVPYLTTNEMPNDLHYKHTHCTHTHIYTQNVHILIAYLTTNEMPNNIPKYRWLLTPYCMYVCMYVCMYTVTFQKTAVFMHYTQTYTYRREESLSYSSISKDSCVYA